jgi:hypothetical protein
MQLRFKELFALTSQPNSGTVRSATSETERRKRHGVPKEQPVCKVLLACKSEVLNQALNGQKPAACPTLHCVREALAIDEICLD